MKLPPEVPERGRQASSRSAPDEVPDAAPCAARRHCRPSGIAARQGRKRRIYRLADDLAFEIDELLPIVDAAQLLGFLKIEEGDAVITPAGRGVRQLGDPAAERAVPRRRCSRTFCSCGRFAVPSKPKATAPFPRNSSTTCSTSNSAKKKPAADGDGHQRGAATPSCSTSMPRAVASSCPIAGGRSLPAARRRRVNTQHPFPIARHGPQLALRSRSGGRDLRPRDLLCHRSYGCLLDGSPVPVVPISHSSRALPLYAFYSIVRIGIAYMLSLFFAIAYGYLAAYKPGSGGDDCGARHPAIHSGAQFSASGGAGHGRPRSRSSAGNRNGSHPADLYRPGLEPGIQLLFLAQSIPREMVEASRIYRYSAWQRFWQLELPYAAIGLVWNSIVSVAGGWFALMLCEMFTMGTRSSVCRDWAVTFSQPQIPETPARCSAE